MIEHPIKKIVLGADQWEFPGAEINTPAADTTLLPPGQHAIPKKEAQPVAAACSLQNFVPDAEKNADFYSTGLPSRCYFYDFKELSVRKVTGRVQAKFSRAGAEGNTRHLVEGVSALLGNGVSAFDLSAFDFRWLMHFILVLSYPSSPRHVTVQCRCEEHVDKVLAGELPEHTLRQVVNFNRPTQEEVFFEPSKLKELDLSALDGFNLGIYTMRDSVEFDETFTNPNEEDVFIYDLAAYLKGGSLEERANQVRDMSIPQLKALEAYREVARQHGIRSYVKSVCKECGTETVTDVTVSVLDFL